MSRFRNIFFKDKSPVIPTIGDGKCVYAVGDVHGRFDLLDAMLREIAQDMQRAQNVSSEIIFLGDLIDRGPQSAFVIQRLQLLLTAGWPVRILKGNHEELFVAAARGQASAARDFCQNAVGGLATLASYGYDCELFEQHSFEDIAIWMLKNISRECIDFVDAFENFIEIGDYLFVHAGIRPKVPLHKQTKRDLRWIREEFTKYKGPHPKLIIHGHSIAKEVDEQPNRIGIDTGAYMTGVLTAIVLEGTRKRYLQVINRQPEDFDPA